MSMMGQKYIKSEDEWKLRDLAVKLNETYSPRVRMDMQQAFVREMAQTYGHESATRMLSHVWKIAKRLRNEELECLRLS